LECPNRNTLYSIGWHKKIHEWDLTTGAHLRDLSGGEHTHVYSIYNIALFDNDTKIVSASGDCTIKVWDIQSGSVIATLLGH
jgi:WD40 repeat protein